MANVKISSFGNMPSPLDGTEKLTGLQGGSNKNTTSKDIALLSGVLNYTNGVNASVSNTTADVHTYTVPAANIAVGNTYVYTAEFTASNVSAGPLTGTYICTMLVGVTPYVFTTETITIPAGNSDNTRGWIEAKFSVSDLYGFVNRYTMQLFAPTNPENPTFTDNDFLNIAFTLGTEGLSVSSRLSTSSTDLTFSIVNSNFLQLSAGAS